MGWNIEQEKTIEVRKNFPKASDWNKLVEIYCSKDKKSFDRIPKEYQPLMQKFLGKVIGEFICNKVEVFSVGSLRCDDIEKLACLSYTEMINYFYKPEELDGNTAKFGYGWHISDLKIYDKPKELREFKRLNRTEENAPCAHTKWLYPNCKDCKACNLTRPPQSWCYVESLGE
jgi:predicted transcriptional regulator